MNPRALVEYGARQTIGPSRMENVHDTRRRKLVWLLSCRLSRRAIKALKMRVRCEYDMYHTSWPLALCCSVIRRAASYCADLQTLRASPSGSLSKSFCRESKARSETLLWRDWRCAAIHALVTIGSAREGLSRISSCLASFTDSKRSRTWFFANKLELPDRQTATRGASFGPEQLMSTN